MKIQIVAASLLFFTIPFIDAVPVPATADVYFPISTRTLLSSPDFGLEARAGPEVVQPKNSPTEAEKREQELKLTDVVTRVGAILHEHHFPITPATDLNLELARIIRSTSIVIPALNDLNEGRYSYVDGQRLNVARAYFNTVFRFSLEMCSGLRKDLDKTHVEKIDEVEKRIKKALGIDPDDSGSGGHGGSSTSGKPSVN